MAQGGLGRRGRVPGQVDPEEGHLTTPSDMRGTHWDITPEGRKALDEVPAVTREQEMYGHALCSYCKHPLWQHRRFHPAVCMVGDNRHATGICECGLGRFQQERIEGNEGSIEGGIANDVAVLSDLDSPETAPTDSEGPEA